MAITGFDHPGDVVIEILTRLPVRSLLRFKCVCKSWYSLIKNPKFIANHLSYATSIDDNHCVILKHCNRFTRRASVSFLSVSNEAVKDLSLDVPMSPPFFDDDGLRMLEVIFYGPCNGIICVLGDHISNQSSRNGDLISLWNPATREIKRLSVSNVPRQDDVEVFLIEIGFGFDSKSNEYKVIRFIDFVDLVAVRRIEVPLVEVYDLSTDCWRKIDVVVPTFMRIRYAWSTYLDGFYYWWSGDENEYSILSFNFADEVFEKIPPPDIKNAGIVILVDYKGYVALAADDSEHLGISDCTALWVLNRDGDKSTWSKLFKIMVSCAPIVGFLSNGKALMVDDPTEDDRMEDEYFQAYDVAYEHLQLVLYDPCSQHVKHLQAYDVVYDFALLQLVNYVESLVSFKKSYEHDQQDSS